MNKKLLAGTTALAVALSLGVITTQEAHAAVTYCGSYGGYRVYSGNEATTCPFAMNTAVAVINDPGIRGGNDTATVSAYSPTTGQTYAMQCRPSNDPNYPIYCTGGNNTLVLLSR